MDRITHDLGGGILFHEGRLPDELAWGSARFDEAWQSADVTLGDDMRTAGR